MLVGKEFLLHGHTDPCIVVSLNEGKRGSGGGGESERDKQAGTDSRDV